MPVDDQINLDSTGRGSWGPIVCAVLAAGLIAVAMGWMFMSFGRLHRRPAGMAGAVIAMGVAILELLTLIFLMIHAGGAAGLGM